MATMRRRVTFSKQASPIARHSERRRWQSDGTSQGKSASRATATGAARATSTHGRAPSGAEVHPSVILPEGLILKCADLGAMTRFRVSNGVDYDHSGQYMAVGSFEYSSE